MSPSIWPSSDASGLVPGISLAPARNSYSHAFPKGVLCTLYLALIQIDSTAIGKGRVPGRARFHPTWTEPTDH